MKNWLVDRARGATAAGALRFRLAKLLPTRRELRKLPLGRPGGGRGALADGPDDMFAGDVEDLAKGGRGACPDGDVGQRHATGARHGHSSLLRLLARIFEAAGGSLEIGQIVYAVRGRFHAEYPNAASPPGVTADAVARGCGQEPRPVPVLAA